MNGRIIQIIYLARSAAVGPLLAWVGIGLLTAIGCGQKSTESDSAGGNGQFLADNQSASKVFDPADDGDRIDSAPTPTVVRPLGKMQLAIRRGDWPLAQSLSEAVLQAHPDDADAIAQVAEVAYRCGDSGRAADLLVRSCQAESMVNEARLNQADIALVNEGRLFDAIELLSTAVAKNPQHDVARRALFDFLVGTERRVAAMSHGQRLIQNRKFDIELLLALANTETRQMETNVLERMVELNPSDLRPLIGNAKAKLDSGELDEATRLLIRIRQQHPGFKLTYGLLAFAWSQQQRYDLLRNLILETDVKLVSEQPHYWMAIAALAEHQGQFAAAIEAACHAATLDPDWVLPWIRLADSLRQYEPIEEPVLSNDNSPHAIQTADRLLEYEKQIAEKAKRLTRFNQQRQRFERTGKISPELVVSMVETLEELGRYWEAEAWVSCAMALPEDPSLDLVGLRKHVVAGLVQNRAWRSGELLGAMHPLSQDKSIRENSLVAFTNSISEATLDGGGAGTDDSLASLDRITRREHDSSAPEQSAKQQETISANPTSAGFRLVDESESRGLQFFGRTSDHLDRAGIMLYQTLGCGGGTIDFDLDGWSDLYLMDAGGTPPAADSRPNAMWRNLDGQFLNVTDHSGGADVGFGQGVAVADVNADGFPDLLTLNFGLNRLYLNQTDGTFRDVTDPWLTETQRGHEQDWSTSAAIGDTDLDGIADAVIVQYCAGIKAVTEVCAMDGSDQIRSCTPVMFPALADQFVRGNLSGGWLTNRDAEIIEPDILGRGLGIVMGNLDGQTGLEVLIANDMTNNHFWSRNPNSVSNADEDLVPANRWSESALPRGLAVDAQSLSQGSMGIAVGDFNNDQSVDFYVTNFSGEYNTLHLQTDRGRWIDQTRRRGLSDPTMSLVGFGTEAIDLDADGVSELVVTNGHVDIFSRDQQTSIYQQPLQCFRASGRGGDRWEMVSIEGDYTDADHVGRALWTIDANRDRRTDLVITHQTEPVSLLINRGDKSPDAQQSDVQILELRLVGTRACRDAVGATVSVVAGPRRWTVPVVSGDGYQCSNERIIRIAIITEMPIDSSEPTADVTVRWPLGDTQTFSNLSREESWLLVEGQPAAYAMDQ